LPELAAHPDEDASSQVTARRDCKKRSLSHSFRIRRDIRYVNVVHTNSRGRPRSQAL
jgi:hypothetical protein